MATCGLTSSFLRGVSEYVLFCEELYWSSGMSSPDQLVHEISQDLYCVEDGPSYRSGSLIPSLHWHAPSRLSHRRCAPVADQRPP
jgi:hypothetical protein